MRTAIGLVAMALDMMDQHGPERFPAGVDERTIEMRAQHTEPRRMQLLQRARNVQFTGPGCTVEPPSAAHASLTLITLDPAKVTNVTLPGGSP